MTETSKVKSKSPCPRCREKGADRSGDNLVQYEDGGAHCFACSYHVFPDGEGHMETKLDETVKDWNPVVGEARALPHRKITEEIARLYNYRTAKVQGKPVEVANYYRDGKLVGQKIRRVDVKRFLAQGGMRDAPLYGQHLWRHGGKRIVITEGETDCLAVAQLLKGRWPVVSVPNGAAGAADAVKRELEFLNSYDEVIICFDMDEPGQEAALEVAKLLRPGKAKIMTLPRKDASEMLINNQSAALSTAMWEAKTYRPDGIIHVREVAERPPQDIQIYPFPWETATQRLYGQRSGEITMFTSGTGMGKSTLLREISYSHLVAGRSVGMLMLEENPEETMNDFIGLHLKKPVRQIMAARRLNDQLERQNCRPIEFELLDDLTDDEMIGAKEELSQMGLYLYDHRGENLATSLLSKLDYMGTGLGTEIIVLDHISVVVASMNGGNERTEIDHLMTDLRSLVNRTGVHLDCVTQLRKADGKPYEEGGRITLQDLRGSGSLSSVPNVVIAVERNQQHPDPQIANTMVVRSLKDRFSGFTGVAMALQYDKQSHRLKEVDFHLDEDGNLEPGPTGVEDLAEFTENDIAHV